MNKYADPFSYDRVEEVDARQFWLKKTQVSEISGNDEGMLGVLTKDIGGEYSQKRMYSFGYILSKGTTSYFLRTNV